MRAGGRHLYLGPTSARILSVGLASYHRTLLAHEAFMELLVQNLLNGLSIGAFYALVALGYTMVYGVLKLINFAHGDMFMWGAYLGWTALLVFATGSALRSVGHGAGHDPGDRSRHGPARRAARTRRLPSLAGAGRLPPVISALGVAFILESGARNLYGASYQIMPAAVNITGRFNLGGYVTVGLTQILALLASLLLMAALYLFVNYTRVGTAMRAVSLDHDTSRLMGIDVNRIITIVFLIGPAPRWCRRFTGSPPLRFVQLHPGLDVRPQGFHRRHPGRHRQYSRRHARRHAPGHHREHERRTISLPVEGRRRIRLAGLDLDRPARPDCWANALQRSSDDPTRSHTRLYHLPVGGSMTDILQRARQLRPSYWWGFLLLVAILLPLPLDDYIRTVLWTVGIYVLLGLSLNIIVGYAGLFQLGHAAFYAIGAYTVALLNLRLHVPILLGLPVAVLLAGAVGYTISRPVLHLRGDYLAIVTIAFGEIVRMLLVNNIGGITGGANGLFGIDQPALFGFVANTILRNYYLVLFFVALVIICLAAPRRFTPGTGMDVRAGGRARC